MGYDLTFTDYGVSTPDTEEVLQAVQEIFTSALGTDLDLDPSTPQGQLITAITNIIVRKNSDLLFLINQFNPSTSSGVYQDALAQLYFLKRKPATSSVVYCTCVGLEGTVLYGKNEANPAYVQSTTGDIFVCSNTVVIPEEGTLSVLFESVEKGEVPVLANTITKIYKQVSGWDTVNNPTSGTMGTLQESQFELEQRRKRSLALNATGNVDSVYAGVANCSNVLDCVVKENDTNIPVAYKGVTITPHSIYVAVNGGDSEEIARAIKNKKSGGCMTCNTAQYGETVYLDDAFLPIKFDRVGFVQTWVKVVVAEELTDEAKEQIKKVVVDNFNGNDEVGDKISLEETYYASRYYQPLYTNGFNSIISIKIGYEEDEIDEDKLTFYVNVLPSLDTDHVIVEEQVNG